MIKGMENLAYPFFKNSGFSKAGVIEDERAQKYGHQKGRQGFFWRWELIWQILQNGGNFTHRSCSEIHMYAEPLMENIAWENLTEKRKRRLTGKMQTLSKKLAGIDYTKPARTGVAAKAKFYFCRMMQKALYKKNPEYLDAKYWSEQGWLEKSRPWKM